MRGTRHNETISTVAATLREDPEEVRDLVRLGLISYLVMPGAVGDDDRILVDADEVTAGLRRMRGQDARATSRELVFGRCIRVLHIYVAEAEPVRDADEAIDLDAPLWARVQGGHEGRVERLHVRPRSIASWANARWPDSPVTSSALRRALTSLGAKERRGVSEASTGNQVWSTWWLLPASLTSSGGAAVDALAQGSISRS